MNLHVTFEEFNGIIHVYETNKDGGGRYQLGNIIYNPRGTGYYTYHEVCTVGLELYQLQQITAKIQELKAELESK